MNTTPDAAHVEHFRTVIAGRIGLQFEDAKRGWLAEVLRRRSKAHGESSETYITRLGGAEAHIELGALAQELTVGETYFLRNIDQFRALRQQVWPERLRARAMRRRIQVLSAGCASGEEAYSIAMSLHDLLPDAGWQLSIRAVDLNPAALDKARRARYSAWSLRETPPLQQQRWFRAERGDYVLDDAIRDAVQFEQRNLGEDDPDLWAPDSYDIVFCRNVLMYFAANRAQDAVARITRSLVPGGYLFLGHAETLRGLSHDYHLRHTQEAFYYQRKDAIDEARPLEAVPALPVSTAGPALTAAVESADSWVEAIEQATERIRVLGARADEARKPTQRVEGWQVALGRALELLRAEHFAEALNLVQALPRSSARDPEVLLLHAVLLVHGGRLEEAEGLCHRLLAIDELNAGAHYVLALCREGISDARGAAECDRLAIHLDPAFAMPRLHLGLLARRAGDRDAQRRELGQALSLLQREDASRLLLFGGGFGRDALIDLCRAELRMCGGTA
ncbi:MAG TPA: protein-glutamate O-methyltransferase CheR [Burkholderiaceae bacterium]|nr:protein-glutamate O-methyltransferase CheR [Burkholderiaceae bacterium]